MSEGVGKEPIRIKGIVEPSHCNEALKEIIKQRTDAYAGSGR